MIMLQVGEYGLGGPATSFHVDICDDGSGIVWQQHHVCLCMYNMYAHTHSF